MRLPYFAISLLAAPSLLAQALCLTLDDGPRLNATPVLTPALRNEALLGFLQAQRVQAMFFVTTGNGADRPEGFAQLNALFLGDVISMVKSRGWRIVSPELAFADPAYTVVPKVLPLNGSVLESSAEALGIPLRPIFKGSASERRVGELAGAL